MSFELALGLWAVVTLLALGSAAYLALVLPSPDVREGVQTLRRRRIG